MAMVGLRQEGGKELSKALAALELKTRTKYARKGLRDGAKVVQREAKNRAPVKSGLLRKNIKVRAGRKRNGMVSILVQLAARLFTGKTFYGAFLEYGFKKVPVFRAGGRIFSAPRGTEPRKQIEGRHFMRDATDSKGQDAADTACKSIWDQIRTETRA